MTTEIDATLTVICDELEAIYASDTFTVDGDFIPADAAQATYADALEEARVALVRLNIVRHQLAIDGGAK